MPIDTDIASQPTPLPPIQVRCGCGWEGMAGELLLGAKTPSDRRCPRCLAEFMPFPKCDPDLRGPQLKAFAIDIENIVGSYHAGMTTLGRALIALMEAACDKDGNA